MSIPGGIPKFRIEWDSETVVAPAGEWENASADCYPGGQNMTEDEKMECVLDIDPDGEVITFSAEQVRHFVLVEREECAQLAHEVWENDFGKVRGLEDAADHIRGRGKPKSIADDT